MSLAGGLGLVFILLVSWSFYRAHRDPHSRFDFFDLFMENGRVSRLAFVFLGSWASVTWTFLRLVDTGDLTEGYFSVYVVSCYAPLVIRMFAPRTTGAPAAAAAEASP